VKLDRSMGLRASPFKEEEGGCGWGMSGLGETSGGFRGRIHLKGEEEASGGGLLEMDGDRRWSSHMGACDEGSAGG
jgi:hypothetical protein